MQWGTGAFQRIEPTRADIYDLNLHRWIGSCFIPLVDKFYHSGYIWHDQDRRLAVGLNIKNKAVERLVEEVVRVTGETKTEAIRKALEDRKARLAIAPDAGSRKARLQRFLETEVWPRVPESEMGRRLTKGEEEEILGYGKDGV